MRLGVLGKGRALPEKHPEGSYSRGVFILDLNIVGVPLHPISAEVFCETGTRTSCWKHVRYTRRSRGTQVFQANE